jgi:nucleoside-diphosphate-sugar epimerase
VIFGGAGFIGTHLARWLLEGGRFERVVAVDVREPPLGRVAGVEYVEWDVRKPVSGVLLEARPDWIFNFAAVHREPGHVAHEYFDTNLAGARNVCAYAEAVSCDRIYFTSSISVYGPTSTATDESARICPITPYGGSKFPAELIHDSWRKGGSGRRLVICRPGVVYGPGDPGNILRMIRAIKRGYFAFPGSTHVRKSYAYIHGLLDSIGFVMDREDAIIVYNYVESPTESLGDIARHAREFLGSRAPIVALPGSVLVAVASVAQAVLGPHNPIHPVRVRKAGMSTHVVPQWLIDHGFEFKYSFRESLAHWRREASADFE